MAEKGLEPIACPCSGRHSPRVTKTQTVRHHSPPLAYPLLPGVVRVLHDLCPNAHYIEHDLLEELRTTGKIGASSRRQYPKVLVDLALDAWSKTDTSKPIPRTVVLPR